MCSRKIRRKRFSGVKSNENGGLDYSESNALYSNPERFKPDAYPV